MSLSSMTGFGRCELEEDGRRIVVELKSVNNRYLDINIRLPRALSVLEETVRAKVKERLARGRVDVSVFYENLRQDAKTATVDRALLAGYLQALDVIREATGRADNVQLAELMRLPDVMTLTTASEDMEALTDLLNKATNMAMDQITAMRRIEGQQLGADVMVKLTAIEGYLAQVEQRAPFVVEDYRSRLTQRLQELLGQVPLDEGRLANEVAVFSDRCSIAEELTRLHSHIAQTRQMLTDEEPVGRKLDFIVQEFNREINTICSKANDLTITAAGLSLKNEIEKIREQVQNIE